MQREIVIKSRSEVWLMLSVFAMQGMGWWGIYQFLQSVLEPGKQTGYAGIGILAFFLADCILRWREVFVPMVYTTKWYLLVEIFALYLYGLYRGDMSLRTDALLMGILCIIGHFWCLYLQGMNDHLKQLEGLEQVPEKSMVSINTGVILRILAVLFVLLLLAELIQFDQALEWLGNRLGRVILAVLLAVRRLLLYLQQFFHSSASSGADASAEPAPTYTPELYGHEEGSGYIVGLSVFSIVVIVVFYQMLRREKNQPGLQPGERPDFHYHGNGEDLVEELREEKLPVLPFFRNNREKIRYRFKRRVRHHYKRNVPNTSTAWELNRAMQCRQPGTSLDELTGWYEVARYSQREISDQELKKIK